MLGVVLQSKAVGALREASFTTRETLEIPEVGEDAASRLANTIIHRVFQLAKRGLGELTSGGEPIHRAIACSGGDQRCDCRAAILRKIDGTIGPLDGFFRRDERRLK